MVLDVFTLWTFRHWSHSTFQCFDRTKQRCSGCPASVWRAFSLHDTQQATPVHFKPNPPLCHLTKNRHRLRADPWRGKEGIRLTRSSWAKTRVKCTKAPAVCNQPGIQVACLSNTATNYVNFFFFFCQKYTPSFPLLLVSGINIHCRDNIDLLVLRYCWIEERFS